MMMTQRREIFLQTCWSHQPVRKFVTLLKETSNAHVNLKTGYRDLSVMPGASRSLPVMIRTPNSFHLGRKTNSRVNWVTNNCNLDLRSEKEKTQRKSHV